MKRKEEKELNKARIDRTLPTFAKIFAKDAPEYVYPENTNHTAIILLDQNCEYVAHVYVYLYGVDDPSTTCLSDDQKVWR